VDRRELGRPDPDEAQIIGFAIAALSLSEQTGGLSVQFRNHSLAVVARKARASLVGKERDSECG
jgi:hypothetical protein